MLAMVAIAVLCVLGLTVRYPRPAVVLWILAMETSPDQWLDPLIGGHELIIAVMKGFGVGLVVVLALREGARWDAWNPGFAFGAMFLVGLVHGLYPGLTLVESVRSLLGSAGPFLFGFVVWRAWMVGAVERACEWGALWTLGFGTMLAVLGLDHMYAIQQGAMRLGGTGEAPFLAGFALVGVYAGLRRWIRQGGAAPALLVAVNVVIILLTGARMPMLLAAMVVLGVLLMQRRVVALAGAGALAALVVMFWSALGFFRVIGLAQQGEATALSNRDLVWPYFQGAIAASPIFGWGVGAGKVVIPLNASLTQLIGTNAAHDEYLRLGSEGGAFGLALVVGLMLAWVRRGTARMAPAEASFMWLVFAAFALHSATDNTMIATTSSVFFIWVSAVFANPGAEAKAAA
jgi:O-antigen ligase